MKTMTALILLVAVLQLASATSVEAKYDPIFGYSIILPETVVTAEPPAEPKSQIITNCDPIFGYAIVMPEVVINAPRPEEAVSEYISCARLVAYELPPVPTPPVPPDLPPVVFCGKTVTGNYLVPAGDTVNEDVTVTGGNADIQGIIDGDLAVMGGTVDISGDIEGDVAVFGGNLGITGVVLGDAAVMGGTVHHSGTIEGDLFVIGGTVDLDSGSTVGGDIGLVGGDVNRDDGAVVEGEVKAVPMEQISKLVPGLSKMFRFGHILPRPRVFVGFFSLAWLVVLFILTLLPLVIFPDAMDHIVRRIEDELWISAAIGFGFQICIAPILLLFIVSIIGWLLIPIFCLGMVVAALFGFAALCRVVGDRLTSGFHWNISSPVGLFTLGWLAVMLILIIGSILAWLGGIGILVLILGWTIIYIASTIGTGATIYALFKSAK